MALADDIAREIADRYAGSDAPEASAEDPALAFSGAAIDAINRGDRAAFLAAVRAMLEPAELADEYDPGPPGPGDFDPDTLE